MPERIKCGNCGASVPRAARCMQCGKPLVKVDEPNMELSKTSADTHASRVRWLSELHEKITVAEVQFFQYLADGSLPGLKKIRVPEGSQAVVISQVRCETLGPGEHEVATSGIASSVRAALASDRSGGVLCVCTFPAVQIGFNVMLPDELDVIAAGGNVDAAMKSLSLRTADDLVGTAELSARVRVAEPVKIATVMARELLKAAQSDATQEPKGLLGSVTFPFRALGRLMFGGNAEQTGHVAAQPIKLSRVYGSVRTELALVVRAAVRQERAETLYDTVQVRERITEDLSRSLADTFSAYGLKLDRIAAFKFQCEEYDDLLRDRSKIALQREALGDKRNAAAIDAEEKGILKDRRRVDAADVQDAAKMIGETERNQIYEDALTADTTDRARAAAQARQLSMDEAKLAFNRDQRALDERQNLALQDERQRLQLEKIRMLAQIDADRQRAQTEQTKSLIDSTRGASTDQLLVVAMMQNPALAGAFSAAQQAKFAMLNVEKQLEMQAQFRQQLEQAYGANNQMVGALLQEAVKQWGTVQGKKAEATRAQVVSVGPSAQLLQIDGTAATTPAGPAIVTPPPPSNDNG